MSGSTFGSVIGSVIGFVATGGNPIGAQIGGMIGPAVGGTFPPLEPFEVQVEHVDLAAKQGNDGRCR